MMELISVIIPAYNVEKYIERCLDSVREQSYNKIEIIIVDDGSNDRTGILCDEFARRDGRIRVLHKANGGVAMARNDAMDIIKGDYVAFVDADDYYEKDMLKKLHDAIINYNADMVSCGYYEEFSDRIEKHGVVSNVAVFDRRNAYEEYFRMGGCLGSGCWNKLIKADIIRDIRFKDYKMGEDVEFLIRVLDKCNRVVCSEYVGYHYIHRTDSATRAVFGPDNMKMLDIADEILEYIIMKYPELIKQMYSFHASWYAAQIQVMYWSMNTSVFSREKKMIRDRIKLNREGYIDNQYITQLDRLTINGFMINCYRPVQLMYGIVSKLKKK